MNSNSSKTLIQNPQEDLCICPSFSCYSSDKLTEIAIKVASEHEINNEGDEFEFKFDFVKDKEVLTGELFGNGQLGQIYPVFDQDLLLNHGDGFSEESTRVAIPLGKLLMEDREENCDRESCSSSEADELENIPADTYCVWRPKVAETPSRSPSRCKKSNSTGSASKRWKFLDLMRRSNSEGKDSYVFLTPKHHHREEKFEVKEIESLRKLAKVKIGGDGGSFGSTGSRGSPSAHEALYVRNRAVKEGNKKKSYLPYRRDLVGFFANVNGLGFGKSFPHF